MREIYGNFTGDLYREPNKTIAVIFCILVFHSYLNLDTSTETKPFQQSMYRAGKMSRERSNNLCIGLVRCQGSVPIIYV